MIGIERLIIVGTDGNLYEFIHGEENTKGWEDCCFKNSTKECRSGHCDRVPCEKIRDAFEEVDRWSWRKL